MTTNSLNKDEKNVLGNLTTPLTNIEICKRTGISSKNTRNILNSLRKKGLVVSYGYTAARRHVSVPKAVEHILVKQKSLEYRIEILEKKLSKT